MGKKIFYLFLACLVLLVIWQHELIGYGLSQAKGQLNIIWNTRDVEEVLADPLVADSIKQKLVLVQEIRRFAIDSLGINESENYTTVYDQKGKPVLWVVTGAEPFALEAKEWEFPLLGSFSYKGFFDYEQAQKEEAELKRQGYDTYIGTVSGWSTLGWLRDPVLTDMLKRKDGDLANLIIHELTHGTLFVKDSVDFNENLASFIGDKGAGMFLAQKFGKESREFKAYITDKKNREKFSKHVLRGASQLDSLYNAFPQKMENSAKLVAKEQFIKKFITNTDTISFENKDYYSYFKDFVPNNTFFMSFLRYEAKLDDFEEEFENKFNSDLKSYLEYLESRYPSL